MVTGAMLPAAMLPTVIGRLTTGTTPVRRRCTGDQCVDGAVGAAVRDAVVDRQLPQIVIVFVGGPVDLLHGDAQGRLGGRKC